MKKQRSIFRMEEAALINMQFANFVGPSSSSFFFLLYIEKNASIFKMKRILWFFSLSSDAELHSFILFTVKLQV